MTTVAGIFISAPHDGQIYVAERSRCHSGLGTFATPMSALRPPSGAKRTSASDCHRDMSTRPL
jgi:hypothetical protein